MTWALQDAKSRFSEVVGMVSEKGPQIVTKRGEPVAVVISYRDYKSRAGDEENFVDALLSCPRFSTPLDFERDHRDFGREVEL